MKTKIIDKEILSRISTTDLSNWMRACGWQQEQMIPEKYARFVHQVNEDRFEVEVPLRSDFKDYALRIAEVLEVIAESENRSQLEILQELRQTQVDTLRIRLEGMSIHKGRLPIENGVHLFEQIRELLLAGACAAIEKRPLFAKRKPEQAMDFLRHVTMAPAEEGSFVAVIESPVTPLLQMDLKGMSFDYDPPFERRVMYSLAISMAATRQALGMVSLTGDSKPFFDAVSNGVTANLCDALVGILRSVESNSVDLRFGWSRNRPVPEVESFIHFTQDSAPLLTSASKEFRMREPQPDFELRGTIIELSSKDVDQGGLITVLGVVENRFVKVRVSLNQDIYHQAVGAHDKKQAIFLEGELGKEKGSYLLYNPRNFTIESDE